MRLLIVNGPLLNLTGKRNPEHYGNVSYKEMNKDFLSYAKKNNISLKIKQFDSDTKMAKYLVKSKNKLNGLIINPGAFTHYSYLIREAVDYLGVKTVEVHISDINNREDFRKISVLDGIVSKKIYGHGINGYKEAIGFFLKEEQ